MKHIMMDEQQIMDFEPIADSEEQCFYNYLAVYLVLNGSMTVSVGDKTTVLGCDDFLFVNPFQTHSLMMDENALVMVFLINQELLASYYDISRMEFSGSPGEGNPERDKSFASLLKDCVAYYYGKSAGDGRILLKLNSLYYQIAEQVITSYTVIRNDKAGSSDGEEETLIMDILRYMRMNYQSPMKLEDLADRFYLSTSYVSRFFKKKMGINFGKYLSELRLDAAVRDLENTQKPMTHIAMDNGFPNLSSFNKAFRERYSISPKQYRDNHIRESEDISADEESPDTAYRLLDYFEQNNASPGEEIELTEQIEADASRYTYLTKSWNQIINAGRVSTLLHTAVQDHVLFLREELGFEYVRVWDLYDPNLRIHAESRERKYNFARLDMALDFLVAHHLKPYIEMGFKPNILLDTYMNYTYYEEREILFDTPEEYGAFVRSLLVHLLNRYGSREVSEWRFEQWADPRMFPDGDPTRYFDFFEQAYQMAKSIAPRVMLGGDFDRTYQIIDFENFIRSWSMRRIKPDFFSIYCYPAVANEVERKGTDDYLFDQKSLHDYLEEKREILLRHGMNMPLYVSEWSFTVVNYNVLNDSCFKGANTMQNIMGMYSNVDAMGYWYGSDLFAEGDDPILPVNGRCGLITHQRICKPSFWAMQFMNRLEPCLLAQSEHAMVTMNEFDNYVIACHNFRPLGLQYYVQEEKDISIDSIPSLYADKKALTLKIRISGIKNGLYHVKTRKVNSRCGSVQDEWVRLGKVTFLNQRDISYLDHVSQPRITIEEQTVTDGEIILIVELEAQEIQCIHLFRYVEEDD